MLTSTSLLWLLLALAAAVVLLPAAWRRLELSRAKHPRSPAMQALAAPRRAGAIRELRRGISSSRATARRTRSSRNAAPRSTVSPLRLANARPSPSRSPPRSRTGSPTCCSPTPTAFRSSSASTFAGTCASARSVEESRGAQSKTSTATGRTISGSYGVNLFGYDFYKSCIAAGAERVASLGPVLGPYHPLIRDNVERIKASPGSTRCRSTCRAPRP